MLQGVVGLAEDHGLAAATSDVLKLWVEGRDRAKIRQTASDLVHTYNLKLRFSPEEFSRVLPAWPMAPLWRLRPYARRSNSSEKLDQKLPCPPSPRWSVATSTFPTAGSAEAGVSTLPPVKTKIKIALNFERHLQSLKILLTEVRTHHRIYSFLKFHTMPRYCMNKVFGFSPARLRSSSVAASAASWPPKR